MNDHIHIPSLTETPVGDLLCSIEVACVGSWHDEFGTGPAEWVIRVQRCCEACPPAVTFCDGCKADLMTCTDLRECADCGFVSAPVRKRVLGVEPM